MRNKQSPGLTRAFAFLATAIMPMHFALSSYAVSLEDGKDIPHVSDKAKENFLQYQYAGKNRAFAIAPGGAWAWRSDAVDETVAERLALQACQEHTQQKCVLYALNDRIVFDKELWPTLWGPYTNKQVATKADIGTAVGKRFHNLAWKDAKGSKVSLSSLKGKLVVLHFWGSWCPPCLREFPSLRQMHTEIKARFSTDVEMIMLQLREPFTESKSWAEQYEFSDLPLFDSGVEDGDVTTLTLSNGDLVQDRSIARVFPSTYVLDRNGLVIFSHHGPVNDWLEYMPFLEHAIAGTGDTTEAKAQAVSKHK
jgi:thiol-disulfide isomerase/thioredoxin